LPKISSVHDDLPVNSVVYLIHTIQFLERYSSHY